METLLAPSPYAPVMEDRQIVLCGVNVPNAVVELVRSRGHFKQKPLSIEMGNPGRVPPSVKHRRLVTRARASSSRWRGRSATTSPRRARTRRRRARSCSALRGGGGGGRGAAAQVAVGEAHARCAAPGRQRGGARDADFKNQKTTLLLCEREVERGLDMPGVDYVYSLDPPSASASYLHRAGRCGRLGATSSGVVTSVVTPEEGSALDQAMVDLEIQTWETLEERSGPPPSTTDAETGGTDGNADVGMNEKEKTFSIEEEERALTAGALNDLFYLVDAHLDAVSALEAVFARRRGVVGRGRGGRPGGPGEPGAHRRDQEAVRDR